ncbi:MAG: chromate resistance protein ChrB domain-containing protein, partial [Rhodospirillales bacterium]
MPSPSEITVAQLVRLIGTPACPVVVDVRIEEDIALDPVMLPGALFCPHTRIADIAHRLHGKRVVVYCQKGKKLSQGAAALLRGEGISAETLEGGHFGWRDAGAPQIPLAALPPRDARGSTLWVTRHRPKIDRLACPWLIRRFVDPDARFLFVAPVEVLGVAEKFNATPFDMEGVFWSHRQDHCTFDTMLTEFGLHTEALDRLAVIVRGADTNRLDLAPEAA